MDERDLKEALSEAGPEDGALQEHLHDEALAARAKSDPPLTADERAHLARCRECRDVYGHLLRSADAQVVPLFTRTRLLGVALAAAVAMFTVVSFLPDENDGSRKGQHQELHAEISLLAINKSGVRRNLDDGDRVSTDDRLGFLYGNPDGEHSKLAIVGFDGRSLHYYYPETAEGAPVHIARGSSLRLREDVELVDHAPGTLIVVAAFDADPRRLAEDLTAGRVEPSAGRFVFRLRLETPR